MRILRILVVLTMFMLLVGCADASKMTGMVISIQDGDTITVLVGTSKHKIRLDGIDCPEKKQAWGDRARQYTAQLAFNKKVSVVYTDKDRYDRILGTVYLPGGRILNRELLKAGLAWHYKQYNSSELLAGLESNARMARIGLWSDPDPVPPWEFRRRKK